MRGVLCLGGAEGALLGRPPCTRCRRRAQADRLAERVGPARVRAVRRRGDVTVMHSVIDILGLNEIARAIFDNAAAAVAGMVRDAGWPVSGLGERCVGITMLGQTTPGVMRCARRCSRPGGSR